MQTNMCSDNSAPWN